MFGMPCLKRENGKVVAGSWKDGGLTVKLTDEAAREQALQIVMVERYANRFDALALTFVEVAVACLVFGAIALALGDLSRHGPRDA